MHTSINYSYVNKKLEILTFVCKMQILKKAFESVKKETFNLCNQEIHTVKSSSIIP